MLFQLIQIVLHREQDLPMAVIVDVSAHVLLDWIRLSLIDRLICLILVDFEWI